VITRPEIKETSFFKYRLIATASGEVLASGPLEDTGEGRDKKAGDYVYTAEVKIPGGGEMKFFVSVVSPTFTRQQYFPFSVAENLAHLALDPKAEAAGATGRFQVVLSKEALSLNGLEVTALAKNENGRCWIPVADESGRGVYEGDTSILPAGKYQLVARIYGTGPKDKEVESYTRPLAVTAAGPGDCELEKVATAAERFANAGAILMTICGSFLWAFYLYRYAAKQNYIQATVNAAPVPYIIPPDLAAQLNELRHRASEARRPPSEEDYRRFALVPDGLDNPQPRREGTAAGNGGAAAGDASPEEAPPPEGSDSSAQP
jgi:hypothetical protein